MGTFDPETTKMISNAMEMKNNANMVLLLITILLPLILLI